VSTQQEYQFVDMDEDTWEETYTLVINPDRVTGKERESSTFYDMTIREFETYGSEHEYVKSMIDQNRVWTLVDADDCQYVVSGYAWVNRVLYYISEVPYPDNTMISIHWCGTCRAECEHEWEDDGDGDGWQTCLECGDSKEPDEESE